MSDDSKTTNNFNAALEEYNTKQQNKSKLFYVYFNDNNGIVCLSPEEDTSLEHFQYTKMPLSEVEDFIIGTKNPTQHVVEQDSKDPTKYSIVPKVVEINYLRRLDRFLSEVTQENEESPHLIIENNIGERCLKFTLDNEIRMRLSEQGTVAPENITINGVGTLDFHFTVKSDPSFLIETITIPTNLLVGHPSYYVNYTQDLSFASLFTRKVFKNYTYIVVNPE